MLDTPSRSPAVVKALSLDQAADRSTDREPEVLRAVEVGGSIKIVAVPEGADQLEQLGPDEPPQGPRTGGAPSHGGREDRRDAPPDRREGEFLMRCGGGGGRGE